MNRSRCMVLIMIIMLLSTGCVSSDQNQYITVSNLDHTGFLQDNVGSFDVYTGSFLVTNPTNRTFENVNVDITLVPTAAYCHGLTKTFNIPRLFPFEKRTVEISIAEFSDLNCQYDYSYKVFS